MCFTIRFPNRDQFAHHPTHEITLHSYAPMDLLVTDFALAPLIHGHVSGPSTGGLSKLHREPTTKLPERSTWFGTVVPSWFELGCQVVFCGGQLTSHVISSDCFCVGRRRTGETPVADYNASPLPHRHRTRMHARTHTGSLSRVSHNAPTPHQHTNNRKS